MNELLQRGIELFNREEFFECHEVLEVLWTPERGPHRLFLQAVIHMAVACYHCQRGNWRGAEGQFTKGLRKLAGYLPRCQGIETGRLFADATAMLEQVRSGAGVTAFPRIAWAELPAVERSQK
jgi:predicted metal-dependent hydrolase